MSNLLARLERHGLALNSGGQTQGIPNAWRLTDTGQEIVARSPRPERAAAPARKTSHRSPAR
jgi:hypothetical protein